MLQEKEVSPSKLSLEDINRIKEQDSLVSSAE